MSDGAPATILAGHGLVRRFGQVTAVAGVDITIGAGEVVGLLGPNGAGKSTTFKLLAGLERPDQGRIELAGVDVTAWPLHRRARAGLGYLPQHASVLPRLSARDNVRVALEAVGRPGKDADELLEEAGLGRLADRPAGALSGGERRRLEVARCLALRPRVVLMDEPFAGVDPAHVRSLQASIRGLAGAGLGVLLTDHAVREALPTCDRAYVLDGGALQVSGSPEQVAADPRARQRYLGVDFRLDAGRGPLHEASADAYNVHKGPQRPL